jgi:hypothetical protein
MGETLGEFIPKDSEPSCSRMSEEFLKIAIESTFQDGQAFGNGNYRVTRGKGQLVALVGNGEDDGEIGEMSGESVPRLGKRGSILFLCCGQATYPVM